MRPGSAAAILALLLALLAGCGGDRDPAASAAPSSSAASSAADEAAVRAAFDEYGDAALAKDGEGAVRVLATSVYDFYDRARDAALDAPAEQVRGLPVSERLTVLVMRGSLTPELLRTAEPEQLVVAAVEAGLVGEQGIRNLSLGEVEVRGETASAALLSQGQEVPFDMEFVREDGRWRIDLLPLTEAASAGLTEAAEQQGTTVDVFIGKLLATKYGPAKAEQLLDPVGRG